MVWMAADREVYRKRAAGPDRPRLAHEAQMLAAIRHPGVVALLEDPGHEPEELSLLFVAGGDLRGRSFPAPEVAGIGAAVATTLADLHDLGVAYRNCSAEHILLGVDGSPVLCSFGEARFGLNQREMAAARRADVQALTAVLVDALDEESGSLRRPLQRWGRQRHPSARSFARLLTGVADARLPSTLVGGMGLTESRRRLELAPLTAQESVDTDEQPPPPIVVRRTRRPRLGSALLATLAVALIAAGIVLGTRVGASNSVALSSAGSCPSIDAGCRPVATTHGILTTPAGQWSLGETGDIVVLGRWACSNVALPALLSPATGQVWIFDSWARPGGDIAARALERIPGATSLAVLPGRDGCDRLQAIGSSGPITTQQP